MARTRVKRNHMPHMPDIDQQHGNERHVIGGREREKHQDFGKEPIAAFDGRGKDALDEAVTRELAMAPAASGMKASGTRP